MKQTFCQLLISSFENDEWVVDMYTATNKRNKVVLWIANGPWFFTGYNCFPQIPVIYRHYLFAKFNSIVYQKAVENLFAEAAK